MNDLISRQAAIELIHSLYPSSPIMRMNRKRWEKKYKQYIEVEKALEQLPSAQPKPLTDREQRIFLAAMGREEKVCEEIDRNHICEAYEDSLMWVCREIKRKVKSALWT